MPCSEGSPNLVAHRWELGRALSAGRQAGRQTDNKATPGADLRSCHVTLPQTYQSMTSAWEGTAGLPPKYRPA